MTKDESTVVFGIFFVIFCVIEWIIGFIPVRKTLSGDGFAQGPFFSWPLAGIFHLFGSCFLTASLVLAIVFFSSSEGTTSGKVGLWLAIPGWGIIFVGIVSDFHHYYLMIPILLSGLITLASTLFGLLLFTRAWYLDEINIKTVPSPSEPVVTQPQMTLYPQQQTSAIPPPPPCPKCNSGMRYIKVYDQYYCDRCNRYFKA